jgi:hypothetical protein
MSPQLQLRDAADAVAFRRGNLAPAVRDAQQMPCYIFTRGWVTGPGSFALVLTHPSFLI